MKASTIPAQYYVPPPDVPLFLSSRTSHLKELVRWAKEEHARGLAYASKKGYYKTVRYLSTEYRPIRILAEMHGFRRICARISQRDWDGLTGRERVFVRRAFELRNYLFKNGSLQI